MADIAANYYTEKMKKLNLNKTGNGYKLSIDYTPIGIRLDHAQDALDSQVWNDVQKYMPLDTGALKSRTNAINIQSRGKVYLYPPDSEYGRYLYEGKVMVDPVYGKGAFFSPEYGFWSRPGVKKVVTDRDLTYSQPDATAHWGEKAYRDHEKEWLEVVKRAIENDNT